MRRNCAAAAASAPVRIRSAFWRRIPRMAAPSNLGMRHALNALATLALLVTASASHAGVCPAREFIVQFPGDTKQVPRNAHLLVELDANFAAALDPASTSFAF